MVAWIIIWGTHVRNRQVGVKGEFCGDCLRVSRFKVNRIETVGHLYYIPLGRYSLHSVTGECHTCGALVALNELDCKSAVPKQVAAEQSITELVNATNPPLLNALSGIARSIETQIPAAQRDLYLINRFCARQSQRFKQADGDLVGWLGLLFLIFLVAVGFAFGVVGPITGIVSSVALLVALFVIRNWAIHRRVAKAIRPQLARFLSGTGIAWTQLESAVESGELRYPQLRRHFKRSAYDRFRQEWNPDEFIEIGNCDVIVPEIDEAAERRAARSDAEAVG